jgi:predicted PurR-regulated permease PerM
MHAMAELVATVRRHKQALFALFMIAVVLAVLWVARGALAAFFIGLALAFVLDPGVTALARRGIPRWAGVLLSYAAVVAIIWALLYFALPPITAQARELVEELPQLGTTIGDIERAILEWWDSLPLPDEVREALNEQLAASGQAIAAFFAGLIAPTLNALVRAATFIVGLVVIPVWLFFVLKDRERFSRTVASAMPMTWRPDVENMLALLARVGGRWVRGQLLLGAAIFVATVIGLGILTLIGFSEFGQFMLILALIAGVLEWFPIIGPIIAAIPAILIGLSISPLAGVAAAAVYIVIQQLENHILVPKVMGDAVDLHPAVLIMALVVGGALFGIGGAILAAPTVAAGRDLYRYGFHRFGGQPPAHALDLAKHGAKPPEHVEEEPPAPEGPPAQAPPPEAEASLT